MPFIYQEIIDEFDEYINSHTPEEIIRDTEMLFEEDEKLKIEHPEIVILEKARSFNGQ